MRTQVDCSGVSEPHGRAIAAVLGGEYDPRSRTVKHPPMEGETVRLLLTEASLWGGVRCTGKDSEQ